MDPEHTSGSDRAGYSDDVTGSADASGATEKDADDLESSDRIDADERDETDAETPKKKRGAVREGAILLIIALVLYYVMLTFVARPYLNGDHRLQHPPHPARPSSDGIHPCGRTPEVWR